MEIERPVACPENEDLASCIWKKRQEMNAANPTSDRVDATLYKAYRSVCDSKTPIITPKDLSQLKGVGKWTLRLMQSFFRMHGDDAGSEIATEKGTDTEAKKGKKKKGSKRYLPQKNSVAYALLITLYRGITNEKSFMRKQELIDAADASGLSRGPIVPEKGKGKAGTFGSSPHEWYSGWNCMKTLITKGLVVKSSCPAKYMLTEEGQEAACECLKRSRLADLVGNRTATGTLTELADQAASDSGSAHVNYAHKEILWPSSQADGQKKSGDFPAKCFEKGKFALAWR